MSEEDKAIEDCENFVNDCSNSYVYYYNKDMCQRELKTKSVKILLELLNSQDLEIEQLNDDIELLEERFEHYE